MNGVATRITVADTSGVAEARRVGSSMAGRLGFDETGVGKVAIAITEAATNLIKHASGGEILLLPLGSPDPDGLEMVVLDRGPGMENFAESLRDGHSTAGSPGTGLGAMSRMAARLDAYSRPGAGTAIAAQFKKEGSQANRAAARAQGLDVAGFSVALRGECLCGDAWTVRRTPTGMMVLVVDGLGHGAPAHEASGAALEVFQKSALGKPAEMMDVIHRGMRATRGASAAVVGIDTESQTIASSGIGNIAGVVLSQESARHLVSMNGTLGHEIRKIREFSYPWTSHSLLILHSDGVSSRWDLATYPGLSQKPLSLIAGVLYRDRGRERDDATVVAVSQENSRWAW